jgi:hypothetical protein
VQQTEQASSITSSARASIINKSSREETMAASRMMCGAGVSVTILAMASAALISATSLVQAQVEQYPNKPVTIISDSAAGSTPDAVLRVIADRLGQMWGQQILAVNHPGATGSIASRIAADSPPDGYTLYMPVSSSFVALCDPLRVTSLTRALVGVNSVFP